MKRIFLALLALLLVLSPALGARRSGGSFGGRTMSRPSVTRTYTRPHSAPRPRVTYQHSTPRVSLTPRTTVRVTPRYQAPARTVIVHHTTRSSAHPYFFAGYFWPHPQAWYPAGTVFTDSPTYVQPVPVAVSRGSSWNWLGWLLVIGLLIILVVWLARRRA